MQRYTHPTQIPRSKTIKSIDWQSELIRIKNPDITGDSHPMTWAADDAIYIGTGDPLYYIKDGVPTYGNTSRPQFERVGYLPSYHRQRV